MDPSSWVNYTAAQHYQRLRGNHHQMNVHPNVPGLNVATQGPGQLNMNMNMNMNDHHVNLSINSAANQAMSGHYSGTAAHPWLFPHGLNATPSHQPTNHPAEHASNPFNPNPFLHHPASYDASTFLSGTFPSAAAKAGYIQTATGFFNPMKKADMQMTNEMSNLNMRGATFPGHCTTMNLPGMGPGPPMNNINNMSADPNSSITTGNIFSSHLGPTSWRHHPNLITSNTPSGPFGVLPHESVNIMNTGAPTSHHSHQTTHSSNSHSKSSSDKHHHHHHKQSSSSAAATAAMANAADNSFRSMIPSLPSTSQSAHSNRNSHQSFDHTTSSNSKLSHHHHGQTDPYNLAAAAAAAAMNHAMNTEYASMQQQRYAGMSSGNHNHNFTGNSNSRGSSYPPVGFNNDPTGRSARELISSNFLHSAKPNTNNSNSTCARNINMMNTSNYLQNCGMMMMNSSANNYSPSPAHSAGNNSVSNNMNHSHSNTSHSRSSSAASNHPLQQGNDSSSCSFGYGSPAATTLPQSPYQQPQRSNTANSSQGTSSNAAASAPVQSAEFTTYGTQVYPSMGTPAPTPTPGYPTPPSSVGQTHVTPQANSQSSSAASSHDDSVSHYPQLTPPTPSSQNNQFVPNYSSTYPSTPKLSNNSRTPESILPNTSSCMVAAAAANMNVNVNNVNAVNQRSSAGYMIGSEQETCLSNIVNVNSLSDADKLSNASLSSSSANVIGHPNEPTLNSVFAPQDIDFPSISFPTNDDTHTYGGGNSVDKMNEQNSYHKKKAKKEKKAKKKDKNKAVGVGVGISLDSNTAYPNYYPQYQNSYSSLQQTNDPYNIMQQQNIQHSSSQQTHNTIMPTTNTSEASANACYDLQYQHITEQQLKHDASLQSISHDTLQTQQVQSQQSQHQQLIQPVVSIQSTQQQVQSTQSTTTTTSISDKQSFPTIDDDLSFLTEPTPDCVSIQNQNANNNIQVETQTPISSAPTISLSEPMVKSNQGATQNSTDGLFSSFMSFIDSSQTQTQTQTQTTDVQTTKEKKKRKHKEIDMKTDVTFNGKKSNKKAKTNGKFDEQLNCRENYQETKENSLINQNNYSNNLMECTTTKKTGDKDYESKFFKRRSSAFSTMPLPVNEISKSNETKSNKKRNKKENKNDLQNNFNIKQTPHDEYEFPDSPLTSKKSTKKKRKSSSSDPHKKPFEKISTVKKTNSNKKSITLTTSQIPSSHPSSTPQLSSSQLPTNDKNKLNTVGCASSSEGFSVAKVSKETKELVPKQSKLDNQRTQVDKSAQEQVKLPQKGQQNQQTQIKKQNQNNNNNHSNNNKKNHSSVKQTSSNTINTSILTTSTCSTKPMISTNLTSHSTTHTNNHSCLSTNSVGMQSAGTNTPRRRSQDKKASAIREGLMRTGDYVIAIEEIAYDLPVIWRIEGKSLLQRFEPSEQDGITVYINTSSVS